MLLKHKENLSQILRWSNECILKCYFLLHLVYISCILTTEDTPTKTEMEISAAIKYCVYLIKQCCVTGIYQFYKGKKHIKYV